jgi:hypothetical protein
MVNTEETGASKLWGKIKDLPIDIFALPDQTIKDHAKREERMDNVFPNDLYLIMRSAAAYPALEEALGKARGLLPKNERLDISQQNRYIVIKVIPKDL